MLLHRNQTPALLSGKAIRSRPHRIMFAQITDFFAQQREKIDAVAFAKRHFESTSGRSALRRMGSVIHSDELGFVVCVWFDTGSIPPGRAWFRVSRGLANIQQLSFDDVRQFGERPLR